eukprot:4650828-Amphidinium_carterae.1
MEHGEDLHVTSGRVTQFAEHTWEILKNEVIEEALALCDGHNMLPEAQHAWRQCFLKLAKSDDMANEKAVYAAATFLQRQILVLEADMHIAHLCVPTGDGNLLNTEPIVLWLSQQHFHAGLGQIGNLANWVAVQGSPFHMGPNRAVAFSGGRQHGAIECQAYDALTGEAAPDWDGVRTERLSTTPEGHVSMVVSVHACAHGRPPLAVVVQEHRRTGKRYEAMLKQAQVAGWQILAAPRPSRPHDPITFLIRKPKAKKP